MSYEDRTLVCRDCGREFIFTAGEQEFYAQKGFLNDPVRCPDCRRARKQNRPPAEAKPANRPPRNRRSDGAGSGTH